MEIVIVKFVCGIFWLIRQIFLSSRIGALAHNYFLSLVDRAVPVRFGKKIPDLPEVAKILRNGRWKSKTTTEFIRKNYELHPRVLNGLIEDLTAWRSVIGYWRRNRLAKQGYTIPANIFLSPTYECNLNCLGCYARGHNGELSFGEIKKIAKEQERLGIFHIVVFGGEPFLREDLWQIYKEFPHTLFDVFTNATLISRAMIKRIAELGNVRIFISLEGFSDFTDKRRGKGTYDKIAEVLRFCRLERIYFGVSVTVARENFEQVTGEEFISAMSDFGIFVISYVLYMPFDNGSNMFSAPTEEQIGKLDQLGDYIRENYPIFPVIGKNGSDSVTSCPAASGRIHITASGDVEPCVFCHYSVDNIRQKSILEVMSSEFFQRIRMFNNSGVSCFNPCKVANSLFLQNDFREAGARLTTQGGK